MAQTNNSKGGPIYVFTVNLQTGMWGSWVQPNSTASVATGDGQSYVEADDQKNHRMIYLPGAVQGVGNVMRSSMPEGGTVTNVNGTTYAVPATRRRDGYYTHGDTVVAYGKEGLYLKNLYVSNPPRQDDVLQLVSIN